MTPEKIVLWLLAAVFYIATSIRLFTVTMPDMLRAADTATNYFALLLGIVWGLVTLYFALKWAQWKKKKEPTNEDA